MGAVKLANDALCLSGDDKCWLNAVSPFVWSVFMTETYQKIKSALLGKKQIHAVYSDHFREMCSHLLGHSQNGEPMALFYQFAGNSSKGPLSKGEWRCMKVNGPSQVKSIDGTWHTEETQGIRKSPCVHQVDVEV